MRKIIASAGLAALGAASVQAAYAPGLDPMEQAKPWSIGLAVRGFYDDNYTTSPKAVERDSWGVSVSPSVAINFPLDQTYVGLSYVYDLRWYEDRDSNEADHIQLAKLRLSHLFNERMSLDVTDSFIYAQEGSVLLGPVTTPTVLATDGDYLANLARVQFDAGVTEVAAVRLAYDNTLYDYEQRGLNSRSALLDRMEHLFTIEGLWKFNEAASGLLGYQFQILNHTASDNIFVSGSTELPVDPPVVVPISGQFDSDVRDSLAHRIYLGAEYAVTSKVDVGVRLGAQFTDYNNADDLVIEQSFVVIPPEGEPEVVTIRENLIDDDSRVTPFVDARGTWTYNPGSYVQLGVVHALNQTDVLALDQQSTSVWLLVNHKITPKLNGSLLGRWQISDYNEGAYDGETDMFYIVGVNFDYEFIPNLSAEVGYNYDKLDSDIVYGGGLERSYDRNRVYFGFRAQY